MTTQEIREHVVRALKSVAPESDPTSLSEGASLRDELDLDSMDFLNFVIALHKATNVDIPEADYAKVQTLGSAVAYVEQKLVPRT